MKKRFESGIVLMVAVLFVSLSSTAAQQYVAAFPRAGAEGAEGSGHFMTWKVSWAKGKSTGMRKIALDQVTVFLSDGAIKITRPDGTWAIEEERLGSVRFEKKGTIVAEEGLSDEPIEAVVIQLKDAVLKPWPITEGVPGQFPRVGTIKLFETDRINVWDETWRPGVVVARHLHYREAVAVFLEGGELRAFTDKESPPPFSRKRGEIYVVSTPLPAPHSEEALKGKPRAIWVEAKN